MRTSGKSLFISAALSVMCVVMAGCSSDGGGGATDSSKKATTSLQTTREQLIKAKAEVRQANAALDKLAAGGASVEQSYKAYTKEVADIKAAGDRARARAQDMAARQRAYVANWEQETAKISSPELKAGAVARRATVQQNFDQIKAAAMSTGDAYRPYLKGLQEIQQVLANDLTPGGVDAAKTAITKTKADGETLVERLDALVAELDNVSKGASATADGQPSAK
jgi:hypothetical protein